MLRQLANFGKPYRLKPRHSGHSYIIFGRPRDEIENPELGRKSILHQLHDYKPPAVFLREQNLPALREFHRGIDGDVLVFAHILHRGESLVDELPLVLVKDEVADRLGLFWRQFLVGGDEPVRVPLVEVLLVVNHEARVLEGEFSVWLFVVKIEHR